MNNTDQIMKVLVTKTDKGLKINLLLHPDLLTHMVKAVNDPEPNTAYISRTFENSRTGLAEIIVETSHPLTKGKTEYAKTVKDPDSDILLVTTL
jgi:hypothetical protein